MHVSPAGCDGDELFLEKVNNVMVLKCALGMAGCVQVCIEASNQPSIHIG